MEEIPNLIYLNQLSDNDKSVSHQLMLILKEEFQDEFESYNLKMIQNDFVSAAEIVHKLRHKIGFLGMEQAYTMSSQFEQNLRLNSLNLKDEFELVLKVIKKFMLKN
jgi:HPt (histidine-containing phosphotransfer) domain-containing protein